MLTNQLTTIVFAHYGDLKTFEYRGSIKDTLTVLQNGYGVKSVKSGKTQKTEDFKLKGMGGIKL